MNLLRLSLVWIACGAAVFAQAHAQDLTTPQPPRTTKAKAPKPARLAPSQAGDLGDIKFSKPYAPPEGAAVAKKRQAPPPLYQYPDPTEPKGGLSPTMSSSGGGLNLGF
jgi:hypothetical protein